MAWKIAYESRSRGLFTWEIAKYANLMASFAATPPIGTEKAQRALEFVRQSLTEKSQRTEFEERFGNFTNFTRDGKCVPPEEVARRFANKGLCRQCGAVMSRRPELVHQHGYVADPPVALRCDACDITRFENRSELR